MWPPPDPPVVMDDPEPWYRTRAGLLVVLVYGLLTLVAVAASTGQPFEGVFFVNETADASVNATPSGSAPNATGVVGPPLAIPPHIYLYGFLGAMAYAFTSIVAKFERGFTGVVRVGLRALAALPLAGGVFLLAGALGIPTEDGRLVAGMAFLVGLYISLTLKALGGLAERLLGVTGGGSSDDEDDP